MKAQKCCALINTIGKFFDWHRFSEALRRFYCLASASTSFHFKFQISHLKSIQKCYMFWISMFTVNQRTFPALYP